MKDITPSVMEGTSDLYSILLAQLTGHTVHKPWKQIAYNLYASENQTAVELSVQAAQVHFAKKEHAGVHARTVKALFDELLKEEQEEWEKKVKEGHKVALKEWVHKRNVQSSTVCGFPLFLRYLNSPILFLVASRDSSNLYSLSSNSFAHTPACI
jgi:hypothetical protein